MSNPRRQLFNAATQWQPRLASDISISAKGVGTGTAVQVTENTEVTETSTRKSGGTQTGAETEADPQAKSLQHAGGHAESLEEVLRRKLALYVGHPCGNI